MEKNIENKSTEINCKIPKHLKCRTYRNLFNKLLELLKAGQIVCFENKRDGSGRKFILQEGEEFRQVYKPKGKAFKQIPRSWFVSNKGNVLFVRLNRTKQTVSLHWKIPDLAPKRIKGDLIKGDREQYKIKLTSKKKAVNLSSYNLVAIAFLDKSGLFPIDSVLNLLGRKGIEAFGLKDDDIVGHHTKGFATKTEIPDDMERRAFNNNPENILLTYGDIHKYIDTIPFSMSTNITDEEYRALKMFKEVVARHNDNDAFWVTSAAGIDIKTGKPVKGHGNAGNEIVSNNEWIAEVKISSEASERYQITTDEEAEEFLKNDCNVFIEKTKEMLVKSGMPYNASYVTDLKTNEGENIGELILIRFKPKKTKNN